MSEIFPRLSSVLSTSTGVPSSPVVHSIEAIKSELLAKLLTLPMKAPLKAEVIAKMNDGTYVANVEEIPLRLALPSTVRVGDKLNLSLIQNHPRPLFALDGRNPVQLVETFAVIAEEPSPNINSAAAASPNKNNNNLAAQHDVQNIPTAASKSNTNQLQMPLTTNKGFTPKILQALSNYQAFSRPSASAEIQLSETAMMIGTVLRDAEKSKQQLSIKSTTPLTDDVTAQANPHSFATRLATQLHQQIEHSGVFYESHIAQWANGQRTLDELKLEPQAKIAIEAESTVLIDQSNEQHQQLSEIVHQQLDLSENATLRWQGQLSPSIPMSLLIQTQIKKETENQTDSHPTEDGESIKTWHTQLELHFPHLGQMKIELQFQDDHSDVKCHVASQTVLETLHQHAKQLMDGLHDRGQKLRSMKVVAE